MYFFTTGPVVATFRLVTSRVDWTAFDPVHVELPAMTNSNMPSKDLPPPKNKLVNRRLTEFFAPSPPSTSSSSLPLPSSTSMSSRAPATASTTNTFRQSASSSRPVTRASKAAAQRRSLPSTSPSNFANPLALFPRTHSHSGAPSPRQTRSASAMATRSSRKRARSPDNHLSASHIVGTPPKLKSPNKRMKKFESNSESEPPQGVIYATSPHSSRKPRARHHLSSATPNRSTSIQGLAASQSLCNINPIASPSGSSKQVVYSSQSDEMELVLPVLESSNLGKVKEDVQGWRHKTFESSGLSLSQAQNDTTKPALLPFSPLRCSPAVSVCGPSPHSDATAHIRSVTGSDNSTVLSETPFYQATCLPSPSDTNEAPPLPPTPQPLDKESKTSKLIADIKARAYAASHFSNDEKPLQFRDLEDSDDDDLDDFLPIGEGKGKRSAYSFCR
ncbi:hypothetical protein PAXRUDRAFT_262000 [Paxillus rubicundulus Ve08.2h10]|uniref:Uncharacterized protein n=1 Tax=Paxillus rubicundulus Ve08.2h10 TaxID=930991 RepID=A0A0D0DFF7_9AGAM|nr:hypothetical protein PAXRUDRAFT_262000 [Paxillus rubicundulus Ve08.2h10]